MKVFVKTVLTLAMPPIVVWAFVSELLRGFGRAFIYAWLDTCHEFAAYKFYMRKDDLTDV